MARSTKPWVGDWLKDSPRDDWGEIDPRDFPAEETKESLADLFDGVAEVGVLSAECARR